MIKNIIAIYPGRFQPFGKHHANAFKWLQQQFGQANAFIVTSDKVDPPKSPFNFNEKKQIISQYGFNNIIQVKNPYKAEELMNNHNPEETAVVFMVGEKDMKEDPRFKIGTKKDGSPSYFQSYKDNKGNLQGFNKHGYLITAPHISIAIPGYGEMSGTELRNVLGTKTVSRDEKAKIFKDVFGWYDKKTADMIFDKLEPITESVFSKDWWKNIFETLDPKTKNSLTEENIFTQIKSKFKDFVKKLKQEGSETKHAFIKLTKAAKGDITLSDKDKTEIGEQLKDTLRLAGLTAIAVAPGGVIVGALLKLLKQEHLVTPSAFVNEVSTYYQNALSQTEKEALKITYKSWDKFGGKECNNGFCDIFARNLSKYLPGSKIMSTEDPRNNTLGHVWIEYNGMYYDAETPNGVNSWKQLPWMKEFYSKNKSYPTDIENLNEVGEASAKVYPFSADKSYKQLIDDALAWKKKGSSERYYTDELKYKFKTDKANYIVTFYIWMEKMTYINFSRTPNWKPGPPFDTVAQVGFTTEGNPDDEITNLNEQFSVLSTITKIILEFVDKFNKEGGNIKKVHVAPKDESSTVTKIDSKRGKFYYVYIKKNISKVPGYEAREGKSSDGHEYIEIYKTGTTNENKSSLKEVGEATANKYKWEEIDREAYSIYTEFKTESDTKYFIDITTDKYKNIPIFTVEFSAKTKGAEGSSSKVVTNKGEMYKVMATIVDIIKTYLKKSKKIQGVAYYPSKKGNEDFGIQRDKLYKAFISKAVPGAKFEPIKNSLYGDGTVALMPSTNVTEGYMGAEQTKKHNAKLAKLKQFLDANIGREFVYDFDMYPKTVVGVGIQEARFIASNNGRHIISDGGAAGHMAHPFNIDWVKNGKDLLEVFKLATEYLKNGPGAVKIDGLNASIRLIELDGKKQFVLDRGSQKDLDIRGITKADLLDRFGEGHGMIQVGGKVLDIFNAALSATTQELKQLGLWNDPNLMFNLEYVSGTSNVIEYGNNFLAIHGLLEITRQTNAKTGKPGARVTKEVDYNEDVMQRYIDKLGVFAQKRGYEVVGSVPTEMKSEPNFTKVLSEKITINYGNGKEETKPMSQWLSMIKVPENETIKLADGKTVNALSKAVLNAVLDGTPLNEFVANEKDIPLVIDGAITYLATAKLGDEVLKNLESKLGPVSDHEGVVIRDERINDKPFKLTGQFIITGQTSQFQKNQ